LVESLADFYPQAKWQRCVVHFYRNVFTAVPKAKVKDVAVMLKAIHAQEDRDAASEKIAAVIIKLKNMKLGNAARIVEDGAIETLSYYAMQNNRKLATKAGEVKLKFPKLRTLSLPLSSDTGAERVRWKKP
jgi:transposase-like protein